LAQIADFLLPTEGIDTVIVFGPRRGKIILSARTTDELIHLGRLLSEKWGGGLSGGHKALAGGQIPFDLLLSTIPDDPDEAANQAVQAMGAELEKLFQREAF
jgi:nanoRNase/pAp phosphatase (c-di-AMP/oligoRNAs hydrolase)